jgi:deazaflavin-dependent oxidoreductase (nitroreductase family)
MTISVGPDRAKMRRQWKTHKFFWKLSGGRLGRRAVGLPVLELVTTGHKSGASRSILITFIDEVAGPAVIGTNAGLDVDPAWVKNLRANPRARIRINGQWSDVVAQEVAGDDHDRIWSAATAAFPGYNDYLKTLTRTVPIMLLVRK